jgi:DNA-directed RNA polymerase subunit RPC12/RpoP
MASGHVLKKSQHHYLTLPGTAMIEFACNHCHEAIRLSDDKAGAEGQCPHCQSSVQAPLKSTLSLHDDAFAVNLAPALAMPVGSNINPEVDIGSKTVALAGTALNWFFGILFLFFFLTSLSSSLPAALSALSGAALLIPPVYRKLAAFLKINPGLRTKVVCVVALFVAYMMLFSAASTEEYAAKKQEAKQLAAAKRQSEREESIQYLKTNKVSILAESVSLLDQGKVIEAVNALTRYQGLGDAEVDAFLAKAEQKRIALVNEEKKARLLEALATVKTDDTKELARLYEQLIVVAPENADYKAKSTSLNAQIAQAEAKQKAETEAAAQLAYKRQMGLVWRYDTNTDQMTQKEYHTAKVDSTNTLNFGFPYQGTQRATLQLRKHPRYGSDAILEIEQGQFLCGYDDCYVTVRFGNGKPQRFSTSESGDNSTKFLFIDDYSRFMSQLRKVDEVVIEARFYQEGSRAMSFSVNDLNWK